MDYYEGNNNITCVYCNEFLSESITEEYGEDEFYFKEEMTIDSNSKSLNVSTTTLDGEDVSITFDINNCPMCGRKL